MKRDYTVVLALVITGCVKPDPKAIWESPDASIDEKLVAAKTLLPSNATLPEIRNILGKPDCWFRIHGPVLSLNNDSSVPSYFDDHGMQYRFGDCLINVYCSDYTNNELNVRYLNRIEMRKPEPASTNNAVEVTIE